MDAYLHWWEQTGRYSAQALPPVQGSPFRPYADVLTCHYCARPSAVELYTIVDRTSTKSAYECDACGMAWERESFNGNHGTWGMVKKLNKREPPKYPYAMNPERAEDEDPVVRRFALLEVEK